MTMTTLPWSRPLTAADLEALPDDGHRYELIDGTLIVTPSPAVPHQRVVGNLFVLLRQHCPEELEVMLAPLDVTVSDRTVLQPDLLVAPRSTLAGRRMEGLPVLAVEVVSPSTRLVDLTLKRAAYERAGVAGYWVVDPREPRVSVWEAAADGRYDEPREAGGDQALAVAAPYPLVLIPADLVL